MTREDALDIEAVAQAVAASPRRDNSAYHRAMAEARQAFVDAENAMGGPVQVRTKSKMKRNGNFTVKWTFERIPQDPLSGR